MDEEDCEWYDAACKLGNGVEDAVVGASNDALEAIADAVTAALVSTIAELGTLWTTIDAPDLTTDATGAPEAPTAGAFNDQVGTILGYATWIGLGISAIALILLAITLVANARRGDGSGLVNRATLFFGATALIGGATSLAGFVVPRRAASSVAAVAFIQDQTFYLTLGLAALGMIVAGVRILWTQRGEPAQELLKGLLTLAIVTASGVALLNILLEATDALARQIIDAGIGDDFQADVQMLMGFVPGNSDFAFLGGDVMLIIVGGIVAVCINIAQIMLMVLRTAMLFLIAGVLPLSAAFMNTEMGKTWFSRIVAWTLAFAFYKPAAALIYAIGVTLTTAGFFSGQGLLQFSAGLMLIVASVVALPVLIGFLSPALGAMSSSGGGAAGAMGLAALGAAIPQGASRLARNRQGFGSTPTAPQGPSSNPSDAPSTAKPMGTDPGTAGSAKAGPTAGAAVAATEAAKKGSEAVTATVQQETQQGSGGAPQGGSGSAANSSAPATENPGPSEAGGGAAPIRGDGAGPSGAKPAGAAGIAGAALQQGAAQIQKQAQQMKSEISSNTGNEDRPNGANRS
ncbi:hypothetical protein [Arthrobacter sp. D2-10]